MGGGVACFGENRTVSFTLKIEIKDKKYKLSFDNVLVNIPASTQGVYPASSGPVYRQADMDKIRVKFNELSEQLKASISAGTKSDF